MDASITVKGLEPLLKFLSTMPRDLKIEADTMIAQVAAKTVTKAQEIVHVKTGNLKRSITMRQKQLAVYMVGSDMYYAHFVEFGTSRNHAYPYLRPAIGATWNEIPAIAKKVFDAYLERWRSYS